MVSSEERPESVLRILLETNRRMFSAPMTPGTSTWACVAPVPDVMARDFVDIQVTAPVTRRRPTSSDG
jgi:hypothetical protein